MIVFMICNLIIFNVGAFVGYIASSYLGSLFIEGWGDLGSLIIVFPVAFAFALCSLYLISWKLLVNKLQIVGPRDNKVAKILIFLTPLISYYR